VHKCASYFFLNLENETKMVAICPYLGVKIGLRKDFHFQRKFFQVCVVSFLLELISCMRRDKIPRIQDYVGG